MGCAKDTIAPPTIFNIFLENMTEDITHDVAITVNINDRVVSKLRFLDDFDLTGGTEKELWDRRKQDSKPEHDHTASRRCFIPIIPAEGRSCYEIGERIGLAKSLKQIWKTRNISTTTCLVYGHTAYKSWPCKGMANIEPTSSSMANSLGLVGLVGTHSNGNSFCNRCRPIDHVLSVQAI